MLYFFFLLNWNFVRSNRTPRLNRIPPSSPSSISCKTKPYIDDSITYICHAVTLCNPSFIASIHLALKAKVKKLLYRVGQHYVMMLGICRGLSSSYVKGSGRCLSSSLSHVDPLTNRPCMVDITAKNISARVAHAQVHNCQLGYTATFSAPALSNILANFWSDLLCSCSGSRSIAYCCLSSDTIINRGSSKEYWNLQRKRSRFFNSHHSRLFH